MAFLPWASKKNHGLRRRTHQLFLPVTPCLTIELRQTLLHTWLLSFQDVHPIEQTILR